MTELAGKRATLSVRLCAPEDVSVLENSEPHPTGKFAAEDFALQEQGDYYFVVGYFGDDPAGTVVLDCRADTELRPEMKSLWVYPQHRRKGVGAALTRYLEETAAVLGFDEIKLGVDPENPAAIPMYINLEYTPTGDHRYATYREVDADGNEQEFEQRDAIYRKSLKIRR